MKTMTIVLALLAATSGCQAAGPDVGSATAAEIQCERFIAERLGQQVDALDFEHRGTAGEDAPTYRVRGTATGGESSQVYQCDVTFDGEQTWRLDDLQLLP